MSSYYNILLAATDTNYACDLITSGKCIGSQCPKTILNRLTRDGREYVVECLLENGCSVNKITKGTLEELIITDNYYMISVLIKNGLPVQSISSASFKQAIKDRRYTVSHLIEFGYPLQGLNEKDLNNMITLGLSQKSLQLLLNHGFSVQDITDKTFNELIMRFYDRDFIYYVKILLDMGYSPMHCSLKTYNILVSYKEKWHCSKILDLLESRGCTHENLLRMNAIKSCYSLVNSKTTQETINSYVISTILGYLGKFSLMQSSNIAEQIFYRKNV